MSPRQQKNIRLDEHYLGMLGFFAERFERSDSEIIRTALDRMNYEYGAALKGAELFVRRLRERHGEDAELEFRRPADDSRGETREVWVGGELDPDVQGRLGGLRMESGAWDPNEPLYLSPREWTVPLFPTPHLYIGAIDPKSEATISISLADLDPAAQEFGGLVAGRGRPMHHMIWGKGGSGRMVTDADLEASD